MPQKVVAATSDCRPLPILENPQTCKAPAATTCGFKVPIGRGGAMQPFCCPTTQDCDDKQSELAKSGSSVRPNVTVCTYAGDKEADCNSCLSDKGIWTALGCIPFNQDEFVVSVVKIIMGVVGLISLGMMLVATIMFMTGGGNSEQIKRGKEIFVGAVVGILFLIFSVVILQIITRDIIKLDLDSSPTNVIPQQQPI